MSTPAGNPIRKSYSAIQFIRNLQNHITGCMPVSAEGNSLLTLHLWISLRRSMTNIPKNMRTHTRKTAKLYGKNILKEIRNCSISEFLLSFCYHDLPIPPNIEKGTFRETSESPIISMNFLMNSSEFYLLNDCSNPA